jgi:hypothetical protein
MTQRFLQAVYSRRPAPAEYDATWINLEFAKINKAIANIPRNTGAVVTPLPTTITADRMEAGSASFGPPPGPGLNLVEYSQQLDVGAWVKIVPASTTVVGNTIMAPDGTLTAGTLTSHGAGGGGVQSGPFTVSATGRVTMSVHIKRLTTTNQTNFGIFDSTTGLDVAQTTAFWTGDVVSGMANYGGTSATDFLFTDAGNGWWRVSSRPSASLDPTHQYVFYIYARTPGSNVGAIYVWGAQVNSGTLITYIETRAITTALAVTGGSAFNGNVLFGGPVTFSYPIGAITATSLTLTPDANGAIYFGRLSVGDPWSYVIPDASSSGLRVQNAGGGANILEISSAGNLAVTGNVVFKKALISNTALATPSAFGGVSFNGFASYNDGGTIMGCCGGAGVADISLKNRAGTTALSVGPNTTDVSLTGKFGCNAATPQAPYASGGLLAGVVAALVANGILSN